MKNVFTKNIAIETLVDNLVIVIIITARKRSKEKSKGRVGKGKLKDQYR